ncbi:energy-coupling factor ABC transporter permease [Methanococcoides methylutens]|uniref:energy-coupling factor ABC transporter permease n=1 Tax=Methanococcoides methylutens TaxID=2226 RepID=UPI004043D30D
MHIPDSFMPLSQALVYWVIALPFIFMSFRWARKDMDDMKIPILAALSAGIFRNSGTEHTHWNGYQRPHGRSCTCSDNLWKPFCRSACTDTCITGAGNRVR